MGENNFSHLDHELLVFIKAKKAHDLWPLKAKGHEYDLTMTWRLPPTTFDYTVKAVSPLRFAKTKREKSQATTRGEIKK